MQYGGEGGGGGDCRLVTSDKRRANKDGDSDDNDDLATDETGLDQVEGHQTGVITDPGGGMEVSAQAVSLSRTLYQY